jgi:hypothetical protein
MNSENTSVNPIEQYVLMTLEFIKLSEIAGQCVTQRDFQKCADYANLYLEPGFYDNYSNLELYNMIMTDFRISLKNVSFDFLNQIDTGKITVKHSEEE